MHCVAICIARVIDAYHFSFGRCTIVSGNVTVTYWYEHWVQCCKQAIEFSSGDGEKESGIELQPTGAREANVNTLKCYACRV